MSASKTKKYDENIKAIYSLTNVDPALCRCCGSLTKFRVLNGNYYNLGRLEVYSDMIKNCFGIEVIFSLLYVQKVKPENQNILVNLKIVFPLICRHFVTKNLVVYITTQRPAKNLPV